MHAFRILFLILSSTLAWGQLEGRYLICQQSESDGRARIVLLDGGPVQDLTREFFWAGMPALSHDAKRILFAAKKRENGVTQIWEREIRAQDNLRKITNLEVGARWPRYVGTLFHLNDTTPSPQILFVAKSLAGSSSALFVCRPDGSAMVQITFNMYDDGYPEVLPNGRIVYVSRRVDGSSHLLVVSNDGTDMHPFAFGRSTQAGPISIGSSRYWALEGLPDSNLDGYPFGAQLASFSIRRPLGSYATAFKLPGGQLAPPLELEDGRILIGARPQDCQKMDLFWLDSSQAKLGSPAFGQEGWHSFTALEVALSQPVRGRSSVVNHQKNSGVLFCLDVFESMDVMAGMRGQETSLRLEVISGDPETLKERSIGSIPVENDGSFHVRVPAEVPLRFILKSGRDSTLAEQTTWTWVLPNESRGCIGCHENPELAVPNKLAQAIVKPAHDLSDVQEATRD